MDHVVRNRGRIAGNVGAGRIRHPRRGRAYPYSDNLGDNCSGGALRNRPQSYLRRRLERLGDWFGKDPIFSALENRANGLVGNAFGRQLLFGSGTGLAASSSGEPKWVN